MAPQSRTDPVKVCLDSDVVIAGLFSREGASYALLVLGEVGLLQIVVPAAGVEEIRRNLTAKLPEALPRLEEFLRALAVDVCRPKAADLRRAQENAHEKDAPILAAAMTSGSSFLVTHNTRHFKSSESPRVIRPRELIENARAWMARLDE